MVTWREAGLVAVTALALGAVGCRETERDRPLHLEPHVYQGDKLPALNEQQKRELQERGTLQR